MAFHGAERAMLKLRLKDPAERDVVLNPAGWF